MLGEDIASMEQAREAANTYGFCLMRSSGAASGQCLA